MHARLTYVLLLALLLGACSSAPQTASLRQQSDSAFLEPALLPQLPFFPQSAYQCGPAALATVLVSSQVRVTPDQLVPLVYVPARKGSFQVEMLAATRSYGRLAYEIPPGLDAVYDEVRAGNPVLVLQNLGMAWYPRWHFAVVKGLDPGRRRVLLNSGTIEDYEISLAVFERTWARAGYWAMVAIEPGMLPASAEVAGYYRALAALEESQPGTPSIADGYRSGLQAWPDDRNLLMGYGNLLYVEGSSAEAARQYRRVLVHHSDYAPAWNNLAEALLEAGDAERARIHALQAIALGGPFIATYHATLLKIEAAE